MTPERFSIPYVGQIESSRTLIDVQFISADPGRLIDVMPGTW